MIARAGRKGAILTPEMASPTKVRAGWLLVANQVFLGSWTVDIHQEGHSQRSVPQKRYMAHLRRRSHCPPRKPSGSDRGDDKMHSPAGKSVLAKHLVG